MLVSWNASGGVVTLSKCEHEEPTFPAISSDANCLSPRAHRRRAERFERSPGCEMALDVECVVDGCVGGEKFLC